MTAKKGQSDAFKLLIAAVVAMAILAIVAGILSSVNVSPCMGNPINEIATTISRAKSGLDATTDKMCLDATESFSSAAFTSRVDGLNDITFSCYPNSPMCSNSDDPISVSSDSITARRQTTFKALIHCDSVGDGYSCALQVKSAD